jgi:hypothetical protein
LSNYLLLLIIILVSISFPTHNSIFPFFRILKTNTFLENVGTIPFFVLKVAYIIILNNKVRHEWNGEDGSACTSNAIWP